MQPIVKPTGKKLTTLNVARLMTAVDAVVEQMIDHADTFMAERESRTPKRRVWKQWHELTDAERHEAIMAGAVPRKACSLHDYRWSKDPVLRKWHRKKVKTT